MNLCQWDNFRDIHAKFFSNIYWTFEKIKEDFENWILYSLSQDGLIRSYIFIKKDNFGDTCEIFGIYGDKFDERIKLVKHALQSIKNVNRIYYFIEDYNEMEACKKLGFKIHGHYQAWEYKSES